METLTLHIIGDGLAGLMLAHHLREQGHDITVHGDGATNTPPVALVHLFAGRTFRRSPLEIEAFRHAIAHWRQEPLAQEFRVERKVEKGDRLDRSAADHDLPEIYAPQRRSDDWLEYGPGFSIATQQLEQRLRGDVTTGIVDPDTLPGLRILALGHRAKDHLPGVKWDLSGGRTVEATAPKPHTKIQIGGGLHIAPHGSTLSLGGRFSSLNSTLGDELAKAHELTGETLLPLSTWSGQRCSPSADRKPVLGWIDERTFAFFGFGSRALFWLPFCLHLASQALQHFPIPHELSWARLRP